MSKLLFNIKYLFLIFSGVAMICSSCRKELHQGPITSTYGSEFWVSQTSVEQAALAMYGQLRACLRNAPSYNLGEPSYFVFGDFVSGLFDPASGDVFIPYGLKATNTIPWNFSYVPYGEASLHNWSRFYQLIAQANLILKNVPGMPAAAFSSQQVRNSYIAEALFVRAYTYFYMIRVWGDPVYVNKTFDDIDYGNIPPLPRTDENVVLDSCLADLRTAAAYLDFSGGDPSKSLRANKGSDYALMAHIFEWKKEYDSAHYYCQEVINKGGYTLEPMNSYTNIWKGTSSSESIFEISMQYSANDPNFKNGGDWAEAAFDCFATFVKGSIVDNQKSSCWISPEGGLLDQVLFDTANDARYKAVISKVPSIGGDPAGYMLLKYTNFNYQSPDTKGYPYFNNNLVLLRLSDIILLDAEALAYKDDLEGARAKLALTEDRAGISAYAGITDAYTMIDEVVMERGRELMGEGQWFYDLIRTEPTQNWLEYVGYPSQRVTNTAKGYYWPLDMNTLFPYDNLLTQNPYWAANAGR